MNKNEREKLASLIGNMIYDCMQDDDGTGVFTADVKTYNKHFVIEAKKVNGEVVITDKEVE